MLEIATRFGDSFKDGFKYAAGFSFCPPTSIAMVKDDVLHPLSASDADHNFLGGCHHQTNMMDANAHVVPVMTTVTVLNERGDSWTICNAL